MSSNTMNLPSDDFSAATINPQWGSIVSKKLAQKENNRNTQSHSLITPDWLKEQSGYVDFNMQITSDSPKVFNGGSLSITSKGVTRIWVQTVSASSSTLRVLVFKR